MQKDLFYRKQFYNAMVEVNESINSYIDLTDYQMIFEADDPNVMNAVVKNTQTQQQGGNALTRACNAILNMIKNLIKSIKDFFARFTMSKSEKNAFYAFREACKKNPSLANKKIHISDYKKAIDQMQQQYNAAAGKIDNAMRQLDNADEGSIDKILADATAGAENFLKTSVSSITKDSVEITAGILEKWGQSSIRNAEQVLNLLENDQKFYQNLVDSMGQSGAEKYKKRMKQYSSKNILMDKKIKITRHIYQNIQECVEAEARELTRFGGLGLITTHTGRNIIKNGIKAARSDMGQEAIAQSMTSKKIKNVEDEYTNLLHNEPKREEYHTDDQFKNAHAKWEKNKEALVKKRAKIDNNNRHKFK